MSVYNEDLEKKVIELQEQLETKIDNNVNVNVSVRVVLTKYGRKRLEEYYRDCQLGSSMKPIKPKIVENGIWDCQLWELMNIFGNMFHHANMKIPFENNTIEILEHD